MVEFRDRGLSLWNDSGSATTAPDLDRRLQPFQTSSLEGLIKEADPVASSPKRMPQVRWRSQRQEGSAPTSRHVLGEAAGRSWEVPATFPGLAGLRGNDLPPAPVRAA